MRFITSALLATTLVLAQVCAKEQRVWRGPPGSDKPLTPTEKAQLEKLKGPPSLDFPPSGKTPQAASSGKSSLKDSKVSGHIVGGTLATRGQWPWQVVVLADNSYLCGGSLISPNWVLTAAHCVTNRSAFKVMLGAQNRNTYEDGRVTFDTTDKYQHPNYSDTTIANDVALLKLAMNVPVPSTYWNTIRLPKVSDATNDFVGKLATVSGWGKVNDTSSSADVLTYVTNRAVISNTQCSTYYGGIISSTICISSKDATNTTRSTCQGDSGGPLVYQETDGAWTQIGVVSFGGQSCVNTMAVAFARVSSFLGWISSITGLTFRP